MRVWTPFVLATAVVVVGCGPSLEQQVPGTWVIDQEGSKLPAPTNPLEMMAMGAANNFKLEVRPDKTFTMNFGQEFSGTWEMLGSSLKLKPAEGSTAFPTSPRVGGNPRRRNRMFGQTLDLYMTGDGKNLKLAIPVGGQLSDLTLKETNP